MTRAVGEHMRSPAGVLVVVSVSANEVNTFRYHVGKKTSVVLQKKRTSLGLACGLSSSGLNVT